MGTDQLLLSFSYALHMLATVVWIGGLLYQSSFLLPAIEKNKGTLMAQALLQGLRTRFQPVAWLSLAVLIGTGLIQMSVHPGYKGFLSIENTWARAILVKHIAVVGMILIAGYQSFILYPRLTRMLIIQKRSQSNQSEPAPLSSETIWIRINSMLSILVLLLTAIARTS